MSQSNLPAKPNDIGQKFNAAASMAVFAEYRRNLAKNSIERHDRALFEFAKFLKEQGFYAELPLLEEDPADWSLVTWGVVGAFKSRLLGRGFSIATVNSTLSIVKKYAALAMKAGTLPESEGIRIALQRGIAPNEAENVNRERTETRKPDSKKSEANALSGAQRRQLLRLPNLETATGRRDAVLLRLLFVYTLRISEALVLTTSDIDTATGIIKVKRIKTKKKHNLRMRGAALSILQDYVAQDAPTPYLFPSSRKGGKIGKGDKPMTRQAAFELVRKYGRLIGVENLSPHDGRHTATTLLADQGVEFDKVRDIRGDAKGSTIALQYIKQREVANDSVSEDVFGDGK